jgi:hypothetical protein
MKTPTKKPMTMENTFRNNWEKNYDGNYEENSLFYNDPELHSIYIESGEEYHKHKLSLLRPTLTKEQEETVDKDVDERELTGYEIIEQLKGIVDCEENEKMHDHCRFILNAMIPKIERWFTTNPNKTVLTKEQAVGDFQSGTIWMRQKSIEAISRIGVESKSDAEQNLLGKVSEMCNESLSPEIHDMWLEVRKWLMKTRKNLK